MDSMKNIIIASFFALCLTVPFSFAQSSTTVSGVDFDNSVTVDGSPLVLNGAGVRTKAMFKLYAAGLYLTKSKTVAADVLTLSGAKRVKIVMLREVSSEDMGNSFMTAINSNTTKAERVSIVSSIAEFNSLFETIPTLKKGDSVTLDWIPGTGLRCAHNNRTVGNVINDLAFFQAVLKIWVGNNPVDSALKTALLRGDPTGSR